jgi:hypothetical protein
MVTVLEHRWAIPHAMTPERSTAPEVSHESLCVLNGGPTASELVAGVFFEERDLLTSASIPIPARRSLHLRLGRLDRIGGVRIPTGVSYGTTVSASTPFSLQYSRLDTTHAACNLMSIVPASV